MGYGPVHILNDILHKSLSAVGAAVNLTLQDSFLL